MTYLGDSSSAKHDPAQLSVRPFAEDDIAPFVDYFTRLSAQDCQTMGIDPSRIPGAAQLRSDLQATLASPASRTFVLVWCVAGQAVGHSSLKDIKRGEFGTMHLHMWRREMRGHGYGAKLFCLSALDFYDRFNLKRIICEPKAENLTPNRMLLKVGFPLARTYVGVSSELTLPCEINRYEILRDVADRYVNPIGNRSG